MEFNYVGTLFKFLDYSLNYELSKAFSDADSALALPSDSTNLRQDRSFSNSDRRHRFRLNANWKPRKYLGIGAVYVSESPLPYNITSGLDANSDLQYNDRPFGVSRNSGRGTWNRQLDIGISLFFSFLNTSSEKKGTKSAVFKPDEIARSGVLTDGNKRFSVKFYLTATNVLNHANYLNYVGIESSPLFGKPLSSRASRQLKFGLRFNF